MSKINLVTVNTPLNSSSFQQEINSNFSAIGEALEKQLQREPQEDVNNAMQQELDMNSYRIINLGAPINPADAARKQDVDDALKPDLEANRVLVSDSNGNISNSSITSTELEALDNISGNIQAQLNSKQDVIPDLEEIRAGAASGASALQAGDLKTINGESLVGEGDIELQVDINAVEKTDVMPVASEEEAEKVYMFVGDTNSSYTHGYIYECKEEEQYSGVIGFSPSKIGFDYTQGVLLDFFKEATPNYYTIVRGTFTYDLSGNLWTITGYDSEDNEVFGNYKLYTEDLEDAGFVMLNPMSDYSDGEVLDYDLTVTQLPSIYSWERVDVQPVTIVDQTYNALSSNAQSGTAVGQAINEAISSVYKPAGSVSFANLPIPSASNLGFIYNVTDSFTTDSRFLEGAGITYPANTNVGIIESNGIYYLDAMAGIYTASLANLTDVSLSSPTNGQVLGFNTASQKWENISVREHYRGDYNSAQYYQKGDVVFFGSVAYIASQDVPVGVLPSNPTYWREFTQDGIVDYHTASYNNEYPIGCAEHDISGDSYSGAMYYMGALSPTINGLTGTLTAPSLKSTTQTQGDNSTKVATTEYVDTALASVATYNSSTKTLEF